MARIQEVVCSVALVVGGFTFNACQATGNEPQTQESQPDVSPCSDCTPQACPGAATLSDGILKIDSDQLRRRRRCLGVHSEVYFLPARRDGETIGAQVLKVENGSILQTIGLKNRDVITSVNGTAVGGSLGQPLLEAIDREHEGPPETEIIVDRDGEAITFRFRVHEES